MSRLCRGNAPHFCANCGSIFEAKTDEDLLQNAVSPPPASGDVERLTQENTRLRSIIKFHDLDAEWNPPPAYDPNFGDDVRCRCGHPYCRHFDTYEDMRPVGCKYCECERFATHPTSGEQA